MHITPPRFYMAFLLSIFALNSHAEAINPGGQTNPPTQLAESNQALSPYLFEGPSQQQVEAEIGRFQVPENRQHASSRLIELSYVKFPSTAKQPGPPIVYLAGGPGGSATGTARGPRFSLFMKLRSVADVIVFDQRGTGLSRNGLERCSGEPLAMETPLEWQVLLKKTIADVQHCVAQWQAQGIDLAGYNTRENAADLDQLRRELGASKISLWGISYGSHLAFAMAKYYPEIIHRMALASLEGLDHTIKQPARVDALLREISAALNADVTYSQRYPQLYQDINAIIQRLNTQPQKIPTFIPQTQQNLTVGLSGLDIQFALSHVFLRDPQYTQKLPRLVAQMKQGDFAEMAAYVSFVKSRMHQHNPMGLAMDAASGISATRWQQVLKQAPHSVVGRTSNFPFPDINQYLPVVDLGDEFRRELDSDIPTLLVAGTWDGRTLYASQRELAARFRNAHMISVEKAGHNVYMTHPEIGNALVRFFQGEKVGNQQLRLDDYRFE
jgi:pimeloyl-ACP methyl ester carboxylesterase